MLHYAKWREILGVPNIFYCEIPRACPAFTAAMLNRVITPYTFLCIARTQEPRSNMWESLQVVEYFLIHVMNTAPVQVRHEVVSAILNKVNQYTSDPRKYL